MRNKLIATTLTLTMATSMCPAIALAELSNDAATTATGPNGASGESTLSGAGYNLTTAAVALEQGPYYYRDAAVTPRVSVTAVPTAAQVSELNASLQAANNRLASATTVKQQKQTALSEAATALSSATQAASQAAENASQKQRDLVSAQSAAESANQTANANVEAARQQVTSAQTAYNNAQSAASSASATYSSAQTSYQNAKSAYEASLSGDVLALKKEMDDAKTALDSANSAKESADAAYATASAANVSAQDALASARTEASQASQNASDKTSAYDIAKSAYEAVVAAVADKKAAYESAKAAYDPAKAAYDEAKSVYDASNQAKTDKYNEYRQDISAYREAYNAVPDVQNHNSDEFFKDMGSNDAYGKLTGKNINGTDYSGKRTDAIQSETNLDSETDTSAVKNMAYAIAQIESVNNLRESVGLNRLQISDYYMAWEQSNVNWSDNNIAHSSGCGAENLAWGYGDPSLGWYYEEKAIFDEFYEYKTGNKCELVGADAYAWYQANMAGKSDYSKWLNTNHAGETVGHYINFINPNYNYIGMAYTDQGAYGDTWGQSLSRSAVGEGYTEAQYKERFVNWLAETYQKDGMSAADAQKAAKAIMTTAEKAVKVNDDATDYTQIAKQVKADKAAMDSAKTSLDAVQPAYDSAKASYDAVSSDVDTKKAAMETAEQEKNDAIAAAQQASQNLASAEQAASSAQTAATQAQSNASQAARTANAAQTTYNNAKAAYDAASGDSVALKREMDDAESNMFAAQTALNEANNAASEASRNLTSAQTALSQAQTNAQTTAREGETSVANAQSAYDQAVSASSSAASAKSQAETRKQTAQNEYDQAVTDVDNAQVAVNAAQAAYNDGAAGRPVTLTEGVHYSVSYSNNNAVGTGTVTVRGIGDNYGQTSRTFDIEEYNPWPTEGLEGFVARLYTKILDRQPDEEGYYVQLNAIRNGSSPAEIAYNYFNSAEYFLKHESAQKTVKRIYQVMFDRDPKNNEEEGWVAFMESGMSLRYVVQGFSQAQEYRNYFGGLGLKADAIELFDSNADKAWKADGTLEYTGGNYRDLNQGATEFAKRMYTIVLGRTDTVGVEGGIDVGGLNVQAGALANGMACWRIAVNYFDSEEFNNKGYGNYEIVSIAYEAILGRTGSDAEIRSWVQTKEDNCFTTADIVQSFCLSDEFENICRQYGLSSGMRGAGSPGAPAAGTHTWNGNVCMRCGKELAAEHTHSYGAYVADNNASCLTDGTETATCSCGETISRTIENSALGHNYSTPVTDVEANCTTDRWTYQYCSRCSSRLYTRIEGSRLGHDWRETSNTATCTAAGVHTLVCNRDASHTVTEDIAALGHEYANGVCTRCGAADPSIVPTNGGPFAKVSGVTFASSGDYFWFDDGERIRSNSAGKSHSAATFTLTATEAGTLSFDYEVSSESSFDGLKVFLNGQQQAFYTGSEVSGTCKLELAKGDVVTVSYVKDGSVDTGSDCAWVGNASYRLSNVFTQYDALDYTTSTDYPWVVASSGFLTSGNAGVPNSSSWFEVTATKAVNMGISFNLSTEENFDKLYIYKNDTLYYTYSGSPGVGMGISLQAGDVLRFDYVKDGSVDAGSDCVHIRLVEVTEK